MLEIIDEGSISKGAIMFDTGVLISMVFLFIYAKDEPLELPIYMVEL